MTTQVKGKTEVRRLKTLNAEQIPHDVVHKLPLEYLKEQQAIPVLLEDGELVIAMADPLNLDAYDGITTILATTPPIVTCSQEQIEQAISQCYYQTPKNSDKDNQNDGSLSNEFSGTSVQTKAEDLLSIGDKGPVIKLVNKLFFQAAHSRASDIHIESYEDSGRARFRIDGVLHDVMTIPKHQLPAYISRLKVMSNLNIAERRLPQDGQSRVRIGKNIIDIRVSVIPTAAGERVVLRLLDSQNARLGLEDVGFTPEVFKRFSQVINCSHGIILLTGPTGSGKTTTLYAALNKLSCEESNILTVEDPIEYQLPGIGQMQVNPKINLTFANCLRHILRQDPDIIMVGEIRDLETARIAIRASLTGHLVLSTLHTNDAASAITRLIDMGIEPYLISSSVLAVMAQRLVRIICPHCKEEYEPESSLVESWLGDKSTSERTQKLYHGRGCEHCQKSGYTGRTGIFELLVLDEKIKQQIAQRQENQLIKKTARKRGMRTLSEAGVRKALAGQTTLEEVYRVTQDSMLSKTEAAANDNG